MVIHDTEREPQRPTLTYGTCAFCGYVGRVVIRQYYVGGQGYTFRNCCLNPDACIARTIARDQAAT